MDKRIPIRPATHSGGVKSISDDDLCSGCMHCDYQPGDMSGCRLGWPGMEDADGYVIVCEDFALNTTRYPAEVSEVVKPGGHYRFDYPAGFTSLPDHTAHAGQSVLVVRPLTLDEADQGDDMGGLELMFMVRAPDGWEGHAFESELAY